MSDCPNPPELSLAIRNDWLPMYAANSQLGLLYAVRRMHAHAKSFTFHPRGQTEKAQPSDTGPKMERVTPGDYFDDSLRLTYIALMQDLALFRRWLPVYLESVGLPAEWGQLALPDPDGSALSGMIPERNGWAPFEHEARQCLVRSLQDLENWTEQSARENELPLGWEPDASGTFPLWPVRNVNELLDHLKDCLAQILKYQTYSGNLEIVSRELRNTRRALRVFIDDIAKRPVVNDTPKDIFDGERELERLIDLLTVASAPAEPAVEVTKQPLSEDERVRTRERIEIAKQIQSDVLAGQLPDPERLRTLQVGLDVSERRLGNSDQLEAGDLNLCMEELREGREAVRLLAVRLGCDPSRLLSEVGQGESESWALVRTKLKLGTRPDAAADSPPPAPEASDASNQVASAEELLDDVCLDILNALDGRALTLEQLANEVSDGNTNILYRRGLKAKLMASGRVSHTKAIGYFRPDAPPLDRMLKVLKVGGK